METLFVAAVLLFFCLFFGDGDASTLESLFDAASNNNPPLTDFCVVELELLNGNKGVDELSLTDELIGVKENCRLLFCFSPKLNTGELPVMPGLEILLPKLYVGIDGVADDDPVEEVVTADDMLPKLKVGIGDEVDEDIAEAVETVVDILPKLKEGIDGEADEDIAEAVVAVADVLPKLNNGTDGASDEVPEVVIAVDVNPKLKAGITFEDSEKPKLYFTGVEVESNGELLNSAGFVAATPSFGVSHATQLVASFVLLV